MEPLPKASPAVELFYRLSLGAKGLLGLSQILAGLGLWLSPNGAIHRLVDWMTVNELAQDATDPLARRVVEWANSLAPNAQDFYTLYLVGHGALNFGVVAALLLRVRGAYHVSLAILVAFVVYQVTQFVAHGDPALIVLTAIDCVVIALVVMERRGSRDAED